MRKTKQLRSEVFLFELKKMIKLNLNEIGFVTVLVFAAT
jgi:hypothetical protein